MSQSSIKRLSPERIAEIRDEDLLDGNTVKPAFVRASYVLHLQTERRLLLGHIEAIEAERDNWEIRAKADMADAKFWAERAESIQQQRWTVEKELTEAKVEIARLRAHCENYP